LEVGTKNPLADQGEYAIRNQADPISGTLLEYGHHFAAETFAERGGMKPQQGSIDLLDH
jgi:hypothetical protein